MPEDRDDLIRHYEHSRAELQAAVEGLTKEQMSERTIDGWSVNDHLSHLVLWDELRAQEVERISAGHETAWRMTEAHNDALSGMAHELRANHSTAQVMWEIDHSRRRLLDAIRNASERGLDGSHYGEAGLRSTHELEHAQWIREWRQRKGY